MTYNIDITPTGMDGNPGEIQPSGRGMDNLEIGLISFILLLWLFVIRIFLQRWGGALYSRVIIITDLTWLCSEKISRHIPTLSVYSKEMSEKIEMEVEKLRTANSVDYSKVDR